MSKVLLFEFLHVHAKAYVEASPSMRSEGWEMLEAVATDLAALPDVSVSVIVCPQASREVPQLSGVELLLTEALGIPEFTLDATTNGPFDVVVPIAPETDGVLAALVEAFRSHGQRVIVPSAKTIGIGTDKWKMFQHLQQHGVPTIPTWRASDVFLWSADGEQTSSVFSNNSHVVIKPVDGAGCDAIIRCKSCDLAESLSSMRSTTRRILQPLIDGRPWSVGCIGRGKNRSPLVLPPAQQNIEWQTDSSCDRPIYRGGTIGAELPPPSRQSLHRLMNRLLDVVYVEQGYVGIDLLRCSGNSNEEWLVTEINPRLCTSYVGYRKAAKFNLAGVLLGFCDSDTELWNEIPTSLFCKKA